MSERSPLPIGLKKPDSGSVLVFAPHADDEVIGCGGTLALHAAQGDRVHVVVVFDGVQGLPAFDTEGRPFSDPAGVRRSEALAGASQLGRIEYTFWGFQEGHSPVEAEMDMACQRVAHCIEEFQPRTIYAPWIGEHHVDHYALARAVRGGLARASLASKWMGKVDAWGYEVWTPLVPERIVNISEVIDLKSAALMEHTSQMQSGDLVHRALGMNAQRSLYLDTEARYGEAFARITWEEEGMSGGFGGVA